MYFTPTPRQAFSSVDFEKPYFRLIGFLRTSHRLVIPFFRRTLKYSSTTFPSYPIVAKETDVFGLALSIALSAFLSFARIVSAIVLLIAQYGYLR